PSSPTGFSPEVARSPTSPTLLPQALQYASVFTLKEKAKWKLEAQAESLCISALSNFKEAPRLSKSVPTPYSTPVADSPSAQSDIVESRLVIVVGMKGGYSVIKAF